MNDGLTGQLLYVYVNLNIHCHTMGTYNGQAAVAGPRVSAPFPATIEMKMGTRKMTLTNHCT